MRPPHETHGITPITYKFHDPHTITTTCYLNIEFLCTFSTNQTKSLVLLILTYKFSAYNSYHSCNHTIIMRVRDK